MKRFLLKILDKIAPEQRTIIRPIKAETWQAIPLTGGGSCQYIVVYDDDILNNLSRLQALNGLITESVKVDDTHLISFKNGRSYRLEKIK